MSVAVRRIIIALLVTAFLLVGMNAPSPRAYAATTATATQGSIPVPTVRAMPAKPVLVKAGKQVKLSKRAIRNCGWLTCSLYLSKKQTKWLKNNISAAGGIWAGAATICGAASLISGIGAIIVGITCSAFWAIYGGFLWNAVKRAAKKKQCLRVRHAYATFGFYSDSSRYCKAK